ncbi:hypothetical protein BC628DRAFT_380486 [Trametes gibbosa]|nr:hypothetical protein BC628DRAFT_380486 [Trametes gibbosa]
MSAYSEKPHFTTDPSVQYEDPPPSYEKDRLLRKSSDAGYRSVPESNCPPYAPPSGPPPTLNSYNQYVTFPDRVSDHGSYTPGGYGSSGPGSMSSTHPSNSYAPSYLMDSDYRPNVPAQRFPELLNPPPPSFQRALSRSMPYGAFAPLEIPARASGQDLTDGFNMAVPPSATQPHPFGTHDVKESDWLRFLDDVRRAGALAARDRSQAKASGRACSAARPGRSGGLVSSLVSEGIQSMQNSKTRTGGLQNLAPIVEILQHWNQHFFNPRAMEVDMTGPVDDAQPADRSSSQSSSDSNSSGRSCRRSRCGKRERGGPISPALRELTTELIDKAAAGGSGGPSLRWHIVVRYKPVGGW